MKESKKYLTLNETASLWGVTPSELRWASKISLKIQVYYLVKVPSGFLPYLKTTVLFHYYAICVFDRQNNPVLDLKKDLLENWVNPSKASKMLVRVKAADIRAMIERGEIGEEDHFPGTFGTQRPLLRKSFISSLVVGKELRNKYCTIRQAARAWSCNESDIVLWRVEGLIPSNCTIKSGSGYYYLKDHINNTIPPKERNLKQLYLEGISQRKENANENS